MSRTISLRRARDYVRTARSIRPLMKFMRPEGRADPYPLFRKVRRRGSVIFVPSYNADPERLDIGRTDNRHLTFSGGPHFCLGAPLARFEGQIAFQTLLRRFPNIELDTEVPEWRETLTLRGLKRLPVRLGA